MTSLLLTFLILFSYYYLISCLPDTPLPDKLLPAFLLTCAQILLTELLLGLTGWLYVSSLSMLNIFVSILVLFYCQRHAKTGLIEIIRFDLLSAKATLSASMDVYNVSLAFLVLLAYSWVIVAAYFLPLRGVDDLFYHLPPVFEYIQTHSIKLLPIEIHSSFAFPQNAELLFLWPVLFTHSQKMLDCMNVPFVLMSILVVYSLLRHFKFPSKDAVFAALLYALCPVVIMQAGSNYIDVLVSLFFLLSLYYTIRYIHDKRSLYAWSAGMAIGIVCGMKYTAFFLTVPFQLIIVWKMSGRNRRQLVGYITIVATLCGWWYVRNIVVMHNPFYPMNMLLPGMGLIAGGGAASSSNFLQNVNNWLLQFPFEDIGIGSYDGGFGLVFWGLGFSSWICVLIYSIYNFKETVAAKFIVLMQLPIGFIMLLFAPQKDVQYDGRLSIFVVAIGLFSLCSVFDLIRNEQSKSVIKVVCVLFSFLTVCLMSTSTMPSYRIEQAFSTDSCNSLPSEFRFRMSTNQMYQILRHIWYPFDYLTMDDKVGLTCYIASNKAYLALSPLYGSNLQNRPVAVGCDAPRQPGAFIYLHYPSKDLFGNVIRQEILYPRPKIQLEDVLSLSEYAVVTQTELGCLIMRKEYLNNPSKMKLLRTYYGNVWPEAVQAAGRLNPLLKAGVPVVTSNPVAYGLLYLDLGIGNVERVVLVPSGFEEHTARMRRISRCYSLDKPLQGYSYDKIADVQLNRQSVALYLNYEQ